MIVDCFPFFNELDLLELRLRTLDRVVDRFVLVEAPFTQRGDPKPLYFAESAARFAPWSDRIVHLVCPGPPRGDPWANEYAQRDYLTTALGELADDDVVLMGDCDEIVDPQRLTAALPAAGELIAYEMRCSFFYANLVRDDEWIGTRAFRAGSFARWGSMSRIRHSVADFRRVRGGWHLTWLGGPEAVRRKLGVLAHTELAIPYYQDGARIALTMSLGCAFDGRPLVWHPPAELPLPLASEPARWSGFLCEPPSAVPEAERAALLHAHGCQAYVPDDAQRVAAVTDDVDIWQRVGRERFGARFAAAADDLGALPTLSAQTWLVVDALERRDSAAVLAAASRAAGAVLFARNTRSLWNISQIARGRPFPPGEALGASTLAADAAAAGLATTRRDRLLDPRIFVPSHELRDGIGLAYDCVRYRALSREDALDLLARTYIVTVRPAAAA